MENSASYWKELYFKVYSENRQLRIELESLKQEYNAMKEKYKTIKSQKSIEYLQKPKNEIKIFFDKKSLLYIYISKKIIIENSQI